MLSSEILIRVLLLLLLLHRKKNLEILDEKKKTVFNLIFAILDRGKTLFALIRISDPGSSISSLDLARSQTSSNFPHSLKSKRFFLAYTNDFCNRWIKLHDKETSAIARMV